MKANLIQAVVFACGVTTVSAGIDSHGNMDLDAPEDKSRTLSTFTLKADTDTLENVATAQKTLETVLREQLLQQFLAKQPKLQAIVRALAIVGGEITPQFKREHLAPLYVQNALCEQDLSAVLARNGIVNGVEGFSADVKRSLTEEVCFFSGAKAQCVEEMHKKFDEFIELLVGERLEDI